MNTCIYLITHVASDRVYVGKSSNPERRFRNHLTTNTAVGCSTTTVHKVLGI